VEEPVYQEVLPLVLEEEILPLDEALAEVQEARPIESKGPKLSVKDIRLGIDFGTTTTAVSLQVGNEQAQALPIGRNGEKYMPSVVYFSQVEGQLAERALIGEDAEAMSMNDPTRVIRSIKRCFGCEVGACALGAEGRSGEKFPWCNGKGKIQVGPDQVLPPSEVAFFIIQEALKRAIEIIRVNNNVDLTTANMGMIPINLGCGANFNLNQRKTILDMASSAGFGEVTIDNVVEEPILAGLAFSRLVELAEAEGRLLIYDFGGGTLDIAIVDIVRKDGKPLVTVLSTAGENWLGGDDIDRLIYGEFIEQIAKDLDVPVNEVEDQLMPVDKAKLLQRAKIAKERLSSAEKYDDMLVTEQLGPIPLSLARTRFEVVLDGSQIVDKSLAAMLRAVKLTHALDVARKSNLLDVRQITSLHLEDAASTVDRVVLVGGVTKIPLIRAKIRQIFGSEKVTDEKVIDPISAVSIGAAYPKETEHFSISSPPYGFYLVGKQSEQSNCRVLIEPYAYLEFFDKIYNDAIPAFKVLFPVLDDFKFVTLKGKKPFSQESTEIKEMGNLKPGDYTFCVGLDGSLTFLDGDGRPRQLGMHPYVHPIQKLIGEERARRQAQANRPPNTSLAEDLTKLMNEN
jgi:molecular chaperone DnaK (HSP70)